MSDSKQHFYTAPDPESPQRTCFTCFNWEWKRRDAGRCLVTNMETPKGGCVLPKCRHVAHGWTGRYWHDGLSVIVLEDRGGTCRMATETFARWWEHVQ